jgi:hypothetical protein
MISGNVLAEEPEVRAQMVAVDVVSNALNGDHCRDRLYGGDLLIFKSLPPLTELCAATDALIRAALGDCDPVLAHVSLDREEYADRVASLQKQCRKDAQIRWLFSSALQHIGLDLQRTCWDWLYLRVLPPGQSHTSRRTQALGFHRDTWASNVYAQINWWTPIYPITSARTLAFYPAYWSRRLENTSANWDLEEMRSRRMGGASHKAAIPIVPEPTEQVEMALELRIVIEPGDLLCFSGAHLHASVPNDSGVTRFSIEVRTVDVEDVIRGRGAPNIDGQAPHVALDWFHRIEDRAPLGELLVSPSRYT